MYLFKISKQISKIKLKTCDTIMKILQYATNAFYKCRATKRNNCYTLEKHLICCHEW